MGEDQQRGRVRFANCRFDFSAYSLERDGEPVSVEPKVLELLAILIARRDRAVGRAELQDLLWPNQDISDSALTHLIYAARQAVGDDSRAQTIIRTVHRRGYQFVAEARFESPVGEQTADSAPVPAVPAGKTAAKPSWLASDRLMPLGLTLLAIAVFGLWLVWRPSAAPQPLTVVALLPMSTEQVDDESGWVDTGVSELLARHFSQRTGVLVVDAPRVRRLLEAAKADLGDDSERLLEELHQRAGADYLVRTSAQVADDASYRGALSIHGRDGSHHEVALETEELGGMVDNMARQLAHQTGQRWRDAVNIQVLSSDDDFVNQSFARGMNALLQGQLDVAATLFDAALGLAPEQAFARYELGNIRQWQGELDEAVRLYRQVVEQARQADEPNLQGVALTQLGVIAWRRGQLDRAREYNEQALANFIRADHPLNQAYARGNLGIFAASAGDHEQARLYYGHALLEFRRARERAGESAVYSNLAVLSGLQGRLQEAFEYQQLALEIQRELDLRQMMVFSLTNLGELYRRLGRFEPAGIALDEASELAVEVGYANGRAGAALGRASLQRVLGRTGSASTAVEQALSTYRELGDPAGQGRTLIEWARIEQEAGQAEQALVIAEQAIEVSEPAISAVELASKQLIVAGLAVANGLDRPVDDLLARVEEVLEQEPNPDLELNLALVRAQAAGSMESVTAWERVVGDPLLAQRPLLALDVARAHFDWLLASGEIEQAGQVMVELERRFPGHPVALPTRTRWLLAQGQEQDALEIIETWSQTEPEAWPQLRDELQRKASGA